MHQASAESTARVRAALDRLGAALKARYDLERAGGGSESPGVFPFFKEEGRRETFSRAEVAQGEAATRAAAERAAQAERVRGGRRECGACGKWKDKGEFTHAAGTCDACWELP